MHFMHDVSRVEVEVDCTFSDGKFYFQNDYLNSINTFRINFMNIKNRMIFFDSIGIRSHGYTKSALCKVTRILISYTYVKCKYR